jgi:hypothetical protein
MARATSCQRSLQAGFCFLLYCISVSSGFSQQGPINPGPGDVKPRVFSLPADALVHLRAERAPEKSTIPALVKLSLAAEEALQQPPLSVTDKGMTPPSGDKHDYMSMGPYWWPDPSKPGGLPYIRRDGETNPETESLPDHKSIQKLMSVTHTLAIAYFVFDDERYAEKAAELLRVWYLDPKTRMNPNLDFGQGIPGRVQGRGTGLIDTRFVYRLVDAVGLLKGSKSWTDEDQKGMQAWCELFLDWMLHSKNGKEEAAAKNNHGTYYDVQVVSLALFTGRTEIARRVLSTVPERRIAVQITADGRQPLELGRTKALGYSTMNLAGLFELALLGENVGVNLWDYPTKDRSSIRSALDFLIPFVSGEQKWPYKQIVQFKPQEISPLLVLAFVKFGDPRYFDLARKVDTEVTEKIEPFLFLQGRDTGGPNP